MKVYLLPSGVLYISLQIAGEKFRQRPAGARQVALTSLLTQTVVLSAPCGVVADLLSAELEKVFKSNTLKL